VIEIATPLSHDSAKSVAIVHDWLVCYSGAERVVEQMIDLYPSADIFAPVDVLTENERPFLGGRTPITTFAQNLPFLRKNYRSYLQFLMLAIEQLDVSQHELVLSSSASIGKGVLTGPDQLHIAYVHSPMRYAWDMQHQYLRASGNDRGAKGLLARWLLHKARLWDLRTANGVDHFIANSHFIARRIWKVYRRDATVIYPPVDVGQFTMREQKDDFYLTVSRLVPYKKVPMIVEAFKALPDQRLVVIGDGADMARIRKIAGPNVEIIGYQTAEVVRDYMQRAKAFVFAAEEDFGISPVEAQACGTPVIAFGRGGTVETIRGLGDHQPTGLFFAEQTPQSIVDAIRAFERISGQISPVDCRNNASRFSIRAFKQAYSSFVEKRWQDFKNGKVLHHSGERADSGSESHAQRRQPIYFSPRVL
jgi:glycosyltransferase involved in cell wall biosynthesis